MAKTIKAVFSSGVFARTLKVFEWDTDDKLQFVGIDLPDNYTVDFANSLTGESKPVLGDASGVAIPPEYFVPGTEIYAWVWISTENGGHTKYQVTIPVYKRAKRTGTTPTLAQQNALDQAIEALNEAAERGTDVFWADYGHTTEAEIEDAIAKDKIVALKIQNSVFYLSAIANDPDGVEYTFATLGASASLFVTSKNNYWSRIQFDQYEESDNLVIYDFTATESNREITITDGPEFNSVLTEVADFPNNKTMVVARISIDGENYILPLSEYKTGSQDATVRFCANIDENTVLSVHGHYTGVISGAWEALLGRALEDAYDFTESVCGYRYDLTTTAKTNLVAAINEVNAKAGESGGGGDTITSVSRNSSQRWELLVNRPNEGAVRFPFGEVTASFLVVNDSLFSAPSEDVINDAVTNNLLVSAYYINRVNGTGTYVYPLEFFVTPEEFIFRYEGDSNREEFRMLRNQNDQWHWKSGLSYVQECTDDLQDQIGDPDSLTTTTKTNLVAAINEVHGNKQDKNLGAGNAGKFLVVGSDGNITTVTMTAWQGGMY